MSPIAINQIRPWMLVLGGVLLLTAGLGYILQGRRAARWADAVGFIGYQIVAAAVLLGR